MTTLFIFRFLKKAKTIPRGFEAAPGAGATSENVGSASELLKVPIKNDVILAYHWPIKKYTGLPLVI